MTMINLSLALLALLITPGPSNALLALAGAQRGLRAALHLIPTVLLCYLVVVVPLALFGAHLLHGLPILRPIVTGLAALWVARLALGLWTLPSPTAQSTPSVGTRQIAITTLLNPKALIFGLVLIPASADPWRALAIFAALVPLASVIWLALGAGLLSRAGPWLNRGAAVWLALLSLGLAAKAFAG